MRDAVAKVSALDQVVILVAPLFFPSTTKFNARLTEMAGEQIILFDPLGLSGHEKTFKNLLA